MVIDLAKKGTYIKLDRSIQNWRWYHNANTFRVFIHCLLCANVTPYNFEGITIKRGEFATSYEKIADTLKLTVGEVRTAIKHLKSTGEITTTIYSKFQVISIVNYSSYQDKSTGKLTGNQQAFNIQFTVNQQQYKNDKIEKNDKNERVVCEAHISPLGTFKNVFLTDDEIAQLKSQYPTAYASKIERLSEYMHQSGKQYKDHFSLIKKWIEEDGEATSSFDTDDFFEAAVKKSFGENF